MRKLLDGLYNGAAWLAALFMIGVLAMVLTTVLALALGIYAAARHNRRHRSDQPGEHARKRIAQLVRGAHEDRVYRIDPAPHLIGRPYLHQYFADIDRYHVEPAHADQRQNRHPGER